MDCGEFPSLRASSAAASKQQRRRDEKPQQHQTHWRSSAAPVPQSSSPSPSAPPPLAPRDEQEATLALLGDMFPAIDADVLSALLAHFGGSDRVIEHLLTLDGGDVSVSEPGGFDSGISDYDGGSARVPAVPRASPLSPPPTWVARRSAPALASSTDAASSSSPSPARNSAVATTAAAASTSRASPPSSPGCGALSSSARPRFSGDDGDAFEIDRMWRLQLDEYANHFSSEASPPVVPAYLYDADAAQALAGSQSSLTSHICFGLLPNDVLSLLLEYLTVFDLVRVGRLSKEFHAVMLRGLSGVRSLSYPRQFRQWDDARICSMVAAFPYVQRLSLFRCEKFIAFRRLFARLPRSITTLNFGACVEFQDEDLAALCATHASSRSARSGSGSDDDICGALPSLTDLDLSATSVTDSGLDHLSHSPLLRQLRVLRLTDTKARDAGVRAILSRASAPARFFLESAGGASSQSFSRASMTLARSPSSRDEMGDADEQGDAADGTEPGLSLDCSAVATDGDNGSSDQQPWRGGLETLHLHRSGITQAALVFPAAARPSSLRELNVHACPRLARLELCHTAARPCPLIALNASACAHLGHVHLALPALETLNLSQLVALRSIELHAPALTHLNLASCAGLERFAGAPLPRLEVLNMHNCRSLNWSSFRASALGVAAAPAAPGASSPLASSPSHSAAAATTAAMSPMQYSLVGVHARCAAPHLRSADLIGMIQLEDAEALELVAAAPRLVALSLGGCRALSGACVTHCALRVAANAKR